VDNYKSEMYNLEYSRVRLCAQNEFLSRKVVEMQHVNEHCFKAFFYDLVIWSKATEIQIFITIERFKDAKS